MADSDVSSSGEESSISGEEEDEGKLDEVLPAAVSQVIHHQTHPSSPIVPHTLQRAELSQLLGYRIEMLQAGSTPLVETSGHDDVKEVAKLELRERRLPVVLVRRFDASRYEIVDPNKIIEPRTVEDLDAMDVQ